MGLKGVRMPDELVASINRWAAGKPHIESFSQAVRVLCQLGFVEEGDRDEAQRWRKWQPYEKAPKDRPLLARTSKDGNIYKMQWNGKQWRSAYDNVYLECQVPFEWIVDPDYE